MYLQPLPNDVDAYLQSFKYILKSVWDEFSYQQCKFQCLLLLFRFLRFFQIIMAINSYSRRKEKLSTKLSTKLNRRIRMEFGPGVEVVTFPQHGISAPTKLSDSTPTFFEVLKLGRKNVSVITHLSNKSYTRVLTSL